MSRLCTASLGRLPPEIGRPGYARDRVLPGVLHLGPGAFHRAHQAPAFDTVLEHDPRWGIVGVSLQSPYVAEALRPQDCLYTLAMLDRRTEYRVIGSILDLMTAADAAAILQAFAAPSLRIVSMTLTEKGYCLAGDGLLDFAHPAVARDLASSSDPRSAIGWLVAGLRHRRAHRQPGVTLLSCDNLAANGHTLRAAVLAFADAVDPDTARWIEDEVRFPATMVDSITPMTDNALRAHVADAIGLEDAWPIQREAFTQWVIEDAFVGDRPELERAGAIFTSAVHAYENAKLRLLNGAHSTLAYVGLELGHATVAAAMRDEALARFVERMMRTDIMPSLAAPADFDLDVYVDAVLARFRNGAIAHELAQIAWDGSQKLPYRLLGTIRDALGDNRPIERLATPIAAWIRFLQRAAGSGAPVVDPLAPALLARAAEPAAILDMREIFGGLVAEPRFRQAVERQVAGLELAA